MPIVATFILFDFVVHNPHHSETRRNMAFLDMAGAYFFRLELSMGDGWTEPSIREFTHIARDYLLDLQRRPSGVTTETEEALQDASLGDNFTASSYDETPAQSLTHTGEQTPYNTISQETHLFPSSNDLDVLPEVSYSHHSTPSLH